MDIPYRKADGSRATVSDAESLRTLIARGEITPRTSIYDPVHGAWRPASEHPLTARHFEKAMGVAGRTHAEGAVSPKVLSQSEPSPFPMFVAFLAMSVLATEIFLQNVHKQINPGVLRVLDSVGVLVALGTFLAVAAWAWIAGFRQRETALPKAVLGLVSVAAFLVFAVLIAESYGGSSADTKSNPEVATSILEGRAAKEKAPEPSPGPDKSKAPDPPSAKGVDAVEETAEVMRLREFFLTEWRIEQVTFLADFQREDAPRVFQSVHASNPVTIRAARTTINNLVDRMTEYEKHMLGLFEIMEFKVGHSKLSEAKKMRVTSVFNSSKEFMVPEVERFFGALKVHYAKVEQLLVYLDGIEVARQDLKGAPRTEREHRTLQDYQTGLDQSAREIQALATSLDRSMSEAIRDLQENLKSLE